jgi:hypothetical protein
MMMNSIEEYQNLVEILKQALMFYAEGNNYNMEVDCGHQARFALSKIEEFEKANQNIEDVFISQIDEMSSIVENIDNMNEDEILNALRKLK